MAIALICRIYENKIVVGATIRIGERAGSGVPDIFRVWEEEGWQAPLVEEQHKPDRTILSLVFSQKRAASGKNKRQAGKASGKRKKQAASGKSKRQAAKASGKRKKQAASGKSKRQAGKTSGKRQKQAASGKNKRQAERMGENGKTVANKETMVDFIAKRGQAKTAEIAAAVGLSHPRTRVLLAELTAEGRIAPAGEGRARAYIPKKK